MAYLLPRFILTGPESTGKSTLAKALCNQLDGVMVEEYLRDYFDSQGGISQEDCIAIASGQWQREAEGADLASKTGKPLICDCDLISSLVYNAHYYKEGEPVLQKSWQDWSHHHLALLKQPPFSPRLYLLCGTDWPWIDDGQRDAPHLRRYFYGAFKQCLIENDLPMLELTGSLDHRLKQVLTLLQSS